MTEDAEVEDFAITRVNIGDKPAGWGHLMVLKLAANLASKRPIDARVQSHEDCI